MKSSAGMTRRDALVLLGTGAAAAALSDAASAQSGAPVFPKGAVIRTILKDYTPEELAGGATLFHEHMQLAPDFGAKFAAANAAARAANGLPPAPARGGGGGAARAGGPPPGPDIMHDVDLMAAEINAAKRDGNIACIVEAGHDRRRLLRAAVVPERDLRDERGSDRHGADQAV